MCTAEIKYRKDLTCWMAREGCGRAIQCVSDNLTGMNQFK